jgi:hypothetical protein
MWLSRWNGVALFSVTAIILCGGLLWANRSEGQPRQDTAGNKGGSLAAKGIANGSPIRAKSADLLVPAPKEQKAAAGRRKALVYALDQNDKRLPARLEDPNGPTAEVLIELPWAVVTGIVDHRDIQRRVSKGGESPAITARELYRRVELGRQTLLPSGTWSDWQLVDAEPTLRILDNLPGQDEEMTPEELRIDALVDPLPFARGATWEGVHVERLVPKVWETRVVGRADTPGAVENAPGNERPPATPHGIVQGLVQGLVNGAPTKGLPPGGIMQFGARKKRRGIAKADKAEPPLLMLRQFDFTVDPGQTYRYRARLVIWDTRGRRKEVAGDWSEPTGPVTVP